VTAPAKAERPPAATAAELDRLTAMLLEALRTSGYARPATAGPTEEKTRRLVRRLNLSAEDAQVWLGMLRKILWTMRSESSRRAW
jgi:tRNA C32,U32 (ribose-2'-O)-methylase TrmJ